MPKGTCKTDGCDGRIYALRLCSKCYQRQRARGSLTASIPRTLTERLWMHIQRSPTGCWLWTASVLPNGYGVTKTAAGKDGYAHRVVYELIMGPIGEGLQLDHLCRVRRCVNPTHLEPVTRQENVQRGLAGRLKTHCKYGHPWIPENIYTRPGGGRSCRVCADVLGDTYNRERREARQRKRDHNSAR